MGQPEEKAETDVLVQVGRIIRQGIRCDNLEGNIFSRTKTTSGKKRQVYCLYLKSTHFVALLLIAEEEITARTPAQPSNSEFIRLAARSLSLVSRHASVVECTHPALVSAEESFCAALLLISAKPELELAQASLREMLLSTLRELRKESWRFEGMKPSTATDRLRRFDNLVGHILDQESPVFGRNGRLEAVSSLQSGMHNGTDDIFLDFDQKELLESLEQDKGQEEAKKPRLNSTSANTIARSLLAEDADFAMQTAREWAKRIGCSASLVVGLPVWIAVRENRPKAEPRPNAVCLTHELEIVLDADGEVAKAEESSTARQTVLDDLIAEQEEDFEPSPFDETNHRVFTKKQL